MIDIEKVVKGLRCIKGDFIPCATCKYANADGYGRGDICKTQCVSETIALLKEHEEQIKNRDESLEKAREEIKWLRGMLKEQEPIEPTINEYGEAYCICGENVGIIPRNKNLPSIRSKYCSECGRRMKWKYD